MADICSQVTNRIDNLMKLPLLAVTCGKYTIKTVYGVVGTALSILTLGLFRWVNNHAGLVQNVTHILPKLFQGTLCVINPMSEFQDTRKSGIITEAVANKVWNYAYKSENKNDFFQRHVISRICYAAFAVTTVVCRTADLALGILGACCAVGTLGLSVEINTFATKHLQSLGVIADVCAALRFTINPHQPSYHADML